MKIGKELNSLESIVEKLKEKALALEEKIEAREDTFNDRSEKWQESEKGEEYEAKTGEMQDLFDSVNTEIETIEGAIEELKELTS